MAAIEIARNLPKTTSYINSDVVTANRAGHHNYVVIQKMLNSDVPVDKMSPAQIDKFDSNCVEYLEQLDR